MSDLAFYLLLFLGWSLIGIIFVVVALITRNYQRKKEAVERSFAQGMIVDRVKKVHHSGRGGRVTYYVPVVEFTVNEKVYRLENENGSREEEKIVVGQPTDVMYDPADPTHFHLAEDDANETAYNSLLRFGLILIAGAAVLTYLSYAYHFFR